MPEPRIIRIGKCPEYLGIDRATFDREIRPHVDVIRLSAQARGVEKVDLDRAFDEYKADNIQQPARKRQCRDTHLAYISNVGSGRSTSGSSGSAFEEAARLATERKLKSA